MELAITAAVAFVIGMLISLHATYSEIRYLRDELKGTHAQIAHAVLKEGAVVPPLTEEIEPLKPLPSELQAVVNEWEGADSRLIEETKIRAWMAEGYGIAAILRQYTAGE